MTDLGPGDDELIAAVARRSAGAAGVCMTGMAGWATASPTASSAMPGRRRRCTRRISAHLATRLDVRCPARRRTLLAPDHRPSLCHRSAAAPGRRAPVVAGLDEMADRRSVPDAWSEVSGRIESERVRSAVETLPGEQRRDRDGVFDGHPPRDRGARRSAPGDGERPPAPRVEATLRSFGGTGARCNRSGGAQPWNLT